MTRLLVVGVLVFACAVVTGALVGISTFSDESRTPVASVALQPTVLAGGVGFAQVAQAGDLEMAMSVAPGVAGRNSVNCYLRDVDGDDKPYTRLTARFSYLDGPLGPQVFEPVQLHQGHWLINDLELEASGRWQVGVAVSRDGVSDARFRFQIALPHP